MFAVVTGFPALIGVVTGTVAFVNDDPDIVWGVGFWAALVVAGWVGYAVIVHRARRRERR